jgi:flagellar biosynthesis GTPase FlhF
MLSSVTSFFKGKKTVEDYQKKIDGYEKQLQEEGIDESKKAEIQDKIEAAQEQKDAAQENLEKAAQENLEKAQQKELKKKTKEEAYNEKLAAQAAKTAEKEAEKAEKERKKAAEEEYTAKLEEEHKIKLLGGFFVYRAKPTTDSKRIEKILDSQIEGPEDQFAQQGEITGMVLIKQSGDRTFMTYAPIDPKEYTVDKFMEYFKDTMLNNKYDDNIEKVFELETLGNLVNKLIVQPVEE